MKKRKNSSDDLTEEVVGYIREDRNRVVKLLDQLVDAATTSSAESVNVQEPMTLNVFADVASRLTDVLTKQNAQLVELVKVEMKRPQEQEDPERLKDDIFEEIKRGEHREEEPVGS